MGQGGVNAPTPIYFSYLKIAFFSRLMSSTEAIKNIGIRVGESGVHIIIKDSKPIFPVFLTGILDLTHNTHGRFCPTLPPLVNLSQ